MKRIITAILACLMIGAVLAGCSCNDALDNNSSSQTEETKPKTAKSSKTKKKTKSDTTSKKKVKKNYENSLKGLVSYLTDEGFLTEKTGTNKNASEIGADDSRFYDAVNGTIELYMYKKPVSNKYTKSARKDNTINLYDKTVNNVFITESGKYLMIYNDSSASDKDSDNYKVMMKCVKALNKFEETANNKSDGEKETEKATETETTAEKTEETETETASEKVTETEK